MKVRKLLCTLLASLFITVPVLSGCNDSGPKKPMFPTISDTQTSTQSPSNPVTDTSPDVSSIVIESTPSEISTVTSIPSDSTITPAAWKVEDRDGHIIYMMGSIHMGDSSALAMPDYIENAYKACDSLAVEADISNVMNDPAQAQQYISLFMYEDGSTIKDHISEEVYNGAVDKLTAAGLYNAAYNQFKPFLWTSLLSMTMGNTIGLSTNSGVDMIFLDRAKHDGKTILEVENLTYQFELFNSFSDALNNLMMAEYLQPNFETYVNEATLDLYNQWKNGTVSEDLLLSGTFNNLDPENAALYQEYIDKLLTTRNRSMTDTAEQYLQNGQKVFFLVGVLHFYGENGIVSLLQKDGYTVTSLH